MTTFLSVYFLTTRSAACPCKMSLQVYFDITIGGSPAGRIVMTLRSDVVPKTAGEIFSKIQHSSVQYSHEPDRETK